MCQTGDIILVKHYRQNNIDLSKHSFIVLNNENGQIEGWDYNLVCNVVSSFHDEEHKKHKLSFPGNKEIHPDDEIIENGHHREGYVKADQIFYFDSSLIEFDIIGHVTVSFFKELLDFIESLDEVVEVVDNLQ